MLTIFDIPEHLKQLHQECKSIATALYECSGNTTETVLEHETNLVQSYPSHVIFVKNGFLKYYYDGKLIRFYNTGDIIITNEEVAAPIEIKCEMGIKIIVLHESVHLEQLRDNQQYSSKWHQFTQKENLLMAGLCSVYLKEDFNPNLNIRNFSIGEIIIHEGERPDCIYEMLEGSAVVTVQNTEVGTILKGEIFGEISFLTDSPRTASVIASTPVTVQAINGKDFDLISSCRPTLLQAMARTTARRLTEVNERLVKISSLT